MSDKTSDGTVLKPYEDGTPWGTYKTSSLLPWAGQGGLMEFVTLPKGEANYKTLADPNPTPPSISEKNLSAKVAKNKEKRRVAALDTRVPNQCR